MAKPAALQSGSTVSVLLRRTECLDPQRVLESEEMESMRSVCVLRVLSSHVWLRSSRCCGTGRGGVLAGSEFGNNGLAAVITGFL